MRLQGTRAVRVLALITLWVAGAACASSGGSQQSARFKPGTQNGVPAAAVFHMPIEAVVRAVRVR